MVLKGANRKFVVPVLPKGDMDGYVDWAKPHIKTLIEEQLKSIQSTNVIMRLWVRWKKTAKLAITLVPEDIKDVFNIQDIENKTGDN